VSLNNGKLLTPLACSQWRLWFMLLDLKIWKGISSQYGCLEGFCFFLEDWEKIQINKLTLPPL